MTQTTTTPAPGTSFDCPHHEFEIIAHVDRHLSPDETRWSVRLRMNCRQCGAAVDFLKPGSSPEISFPIFPQA